MRVGQVSSLGADIVLQITFRPFESVGGHSEVRFENVRGVYADVDLLAKQLCGNQIASGYCEKADTSPAAFVRRLQERFDLYQGETMDGLFVFTVELIHPGGTIVVLARSFSVDSGN